MFYTILVLITYLLMIKSCVAMIELPSLQDDTITIKIQGQFKSHFQLINHTILTIEIWENTTDSPNNVIGFMCPTNGDVQPLFRKIERKINNKRQFEVELLPTPTNIDRLVIHKDLGISCYALLSNENAVIFQVRKPADDSVPVISQYLSPYETVDNLYKEFLDDNLGDDIVIGAGITTIGVLVIAPIIILALDAAFKPIYDPEKQVQIVENKN